MALRDNKTGPRLLQTARPHGKASMKGPPMTILFDATRLVKSARPFAAGLTVASTAPVAPPKAARRAARPSEPTAEDRLWWAIECDSRERFLESQAMEARMIDRLSAGFIHGDDSPIENQEIRGSAVGHPA